MDALSALACGAGPGSFTSLRIAASIAKGLATARVLPLHVAPSPLLIVAGAELPVGRYAAVLDAMRGDVFVLRVDVTASGTLEVQDAVRLMSRSALSERWEGEGISLVGPDEVMISRPHARGFAHLLRQGLAPVVTLASWEPDYGRKAEAQVKWERTHGRELESR
jgi:tRNA threonylcarbamoyladenosine biosynthesis protein TsaB